jgi:hypothetical protein
MRRNVEALGGSGGKLACFVLRFIAELSPCTETSLIAYVSGGDSTSELGHTASASHTRELIGNALLKLKELAFIQVTDEQIAITDEGRRFLDELPVVALRQHDYRPAGRGETKTDLEVETEYREPDGMESTAGVKQTQPCVSSHLKLQARPWTRYVALLRALVTALLAECTPRLRQFCQDRLAAARAVMRRGSQRNGGRAWDIALQVWKRKVDPMIGSRATTLVHILAGLARVCRTRAEACVIVLGNWRRQTGALLSKAAKASGLPPSAKVAGFDLSQLAIFAVALLVVCGVLSITGGIAFLSDKRAESSRAPAFLSGDRAESSRGSPIVWLLDGQDRPERSIFVTRKLAGATWIEGFAITGENTSNQTLTAIQGAIKPDTGEEIKLSVSMAGSQRKQTETQDMPSGSKFTLESAFHPDASGRQTGMPAEEFLSKYGGMIFRFSYTVAGVQTTLIEYFSTSRLKAQLADIESAEHSQ